MKDNRKYLLFDKNAIETIVSKNSLQSAEYTQGAIFIEYLGGKGDSGLFEDIYIEHCDEGTLFVGKAKESAKDALGYEIFCVDLTTCNVLDEMNHPNDLLTIFQKVFRTCLKIWNNQPFSSSERVNQSKSIVFPFVFTDRRRIVIERAINSERLTKRKILRPILAYKYCTDEPHGEEIISESVLLKAGDVYSNKHLQIQSRFPNRTSNSNEEKKVAIEQVEGEHLESKEGFVYLRYQEQYARLTESQKKVVDFQDMHNPLRVEGAAGTGKTFSMIMRAYRLLNEAYSNSQPFKMIFISHNYSSCEQSKKIFCNYPNSQIFMDEDNEQSVKFTTLFELCSEFARIDKGSLFEIDAGDAKSYQLFLIEDVLQKAEENHIIYTYKSGLSQKLQDMLEDFKKCNAQGISKLIQHEFSIQIKGRTNYTFDEYKDLQSIPNGIDCKSEKDKEFIFTLFTNYQSELSSMNYFDVDDVIVQALSSMNAPVWRRQRAAEGYDYIFVDEMHLFNFNEQNVFHYLTRDYTRKEVPICFAIDYCQAVGDRGNTLMDYIEDGYGKVSETKFRTVFRNSPQIADFCAAIAASGVLMFKESFSNPYDSTQNNFTIQEEKKAEQGPVLFMCSNDDAMEKTLGKQLDKLMSSLQCKQKDIAIVSFDNKYLTSEGIQALSDKLDKKIKLCGISSLVSDNEFPIYSAYDVNGLEFQAIVMIGVDEGRIPQTFGTSDISQHFVRYSAYNLLYLTSSRAKYRLVLIGSMVNGKSSCLEHAIKAGFLKLENCNNA